MRKHILRLVETILGKYDAMYGYARYWWQRELPYETKRAIVVACKYDFTQGANRATCFAEVESFLRYCETKQSDRPSQVAYRTVFEILGSLRRELGRNELDSSEVTLGELYEALPLIAVYAVELPPAWRNRPSDEDLYWYYCHR